MSAHSGFLLAALLSLFTTPPWPVYVWRKHWPYRALALAFYITGYALIASAFILDPILQPPLFVHSFVPSIGAGTVVVALAIMVQDTITASRSLPDQGSVTSRDRS